MMSDCKEVNDFLCLWLIVASRLMHSLVTPQMNTILYHVHGSSINLLQNGVILSTLKI